MAFLQGVVPLLLLSSVLAVNGLLETPYTYSYGMLTRPILVDVPAEQMYIQDGEWLYRILTSKGAEGVFAHMPFFAKMMTMERYNYVINSCVDCMILRDVHVGEIRSWVLDSKRIPFDKTFFSTLKYVDYTYGIITDLEEVLNRKAMLNKLGLWDIGMDALYSNGVLDSKYLYKDISKHVDKVVGAGDEKVHFTKDILKHITSTGDVHDSYYPYAHDTTYDVSPDMLSHKSYYPYMYHSSPKSFMPYNNRQMMMRPKSMISDDWYHNIDWNNVDSWYNLYGKNVNKYDDTYKSWAYPQYPSLYSKKSLGDVNSMDYFRNILLGGSKPHSYSSYPYSSYSSYPYSTYSSYPSSYAYSSYPYSHSYSSYPYSTYPYSSYAHSSYPFSWHRDSSFASI